MTSITLHEGDNRESLRRLIEQGVRVHSVVTDPPYGLVSVTKRFGGDKAAPAKFGTDGAFKRASTGFMNAVWDGTGIERDPEFWSLIYDILLPGGYVLAFSSARTGHWQACAMETAGFVMHPLLGWTFGSGFPKAHNAARAIDKALGVAPTVVGKHKFQPATGVVYGGYSMCDGSITSPTSPEAQQWEGWAYGTQSTKPAIEPIYMGQKPFSEKNGALNILKHGAGAINIDGCRVERMEGDRASGWSMSGSKESENLSMLGKNYERDPKPDNAKGRHPANLLHDGSDDVVAMFPDGNDRFFGCFPPDTDPIFYHSKANKKDRAGSAHPTVKPVKLMQWLCRLITPPGGTVLDPFGGSGTTAEAARAEGFDCVLMEAEPQFIRDIKRRFELTDDSDDFDALLPDADDFSALLETAQ